MASKKKQKYPAAKVRREAGASSNFRVKSGLYNGSTPSDDFVVSGHSTGSQNSEMEALSLQVSRDAGRVPDVPRQYASDLSDTGYDEYQGEGLGDLGGPELYGDRPSLLKKSPVHFANQSRRLTIGTAAAALAGSAALAGVAYVLFRNLRRSAAASTAGKASASARQPARKRAAPRTKTKRKTARRSEASASSRAH